MDKKRWVIGGVLLAAALILLPWVTNPYIISLFFMLFVYVGYAEAWNIMSGLTGYVNFGYSLFVGIAGYAGIILMMDCGLWWPLGVVLGGAAPAAVAVLLGAVMLRLRGSYFAIGMLALHMGGMLLFASKYLTPLTRGGAGFPFISPLSLPELYYAAMAVAVLTIYVTYRILTSPFGARLLAIREDEEAAGSLGINATNNKMAAFVLSAFFGGMMGAIHFSFQNYIEPHSAFNGKWTIVPIVMVLLGGPGTLWGPVIGAVILTLVEEFLWSYFTQAYMMIYGAVMVLLVLLMPGGIIEWLKERGTLPKVRTL
ncbi:MAG TPA: branched-chain amino acid ABC transporter permease [Thermodesulfobacteriota bacterium]|nr:branched-chain amino acid ABC transporter permease [Thermodesulfobacteriota bacterium]